MEVKQIFTLINDIANEHFGAQALSVNDVSSFISFGEAVMSSDDNVSTFYQALVDRIGRTLILTRAYKGARRKGIRKDELTFGSMTQIIDFEPATAISNGAWYQGNDAISPFDEDHVSTMTVDSKVYKAMATWEEAIYVYDYQLRMAFSNPADMGSFVSAQFEQMANSMELALENLDNKAVATLIVKAVNATGRKTKVNLLQDYNDLMGYYTDSEGTRTYSADAIQSIKEALTNKDFLKYAVNEIKNYKSKLQTYSKLFNIAGKAKFTPEENIVFDIISQVSNAFETYLASDTYNKELVALPMYNDIPFWQGSGTNFDIVDCTKITLKLETEGDTQTVNNVVAVMRDEFAIGTTCFYPRQKSIYDPEGERTKHWSKCDIGYYVNPNWNTVVFTMDFVGSRPSPAA